MTRGRAMHGPATLARFAGVGLGAALLLYALTWLLSAIGLSPFAAGLLAYAGAFAAAYTAQQGWSFEGRHAHGRALPRYLSAQAVAALTSGAAAHVAAGIDLPAWAGSATATAAASAVSLALSLLWVFPAEAADARG